MSVAKKLKTEDLFDSALLCQADSGEGWCRECGFLCGARGESNDELLSGALFSICNHYDKSNSTMMDESWRDDIIQVIMGGKIPDVCHNHIDQTKLNLPPIVQRQRCCHHSLPKQQHEGIFPFHITTS
jgi:hypothetical protein